MSATANSAEIEKFQIEKGNVIVTKDSESWEDIAVPALVIENLPKTLCGYHLALIKPNNKHLLGAYLFRLLESNNINTHFKISAKGITRYGLSISAFKSLLICLPPLPEQQKIAEYLDYKCNLIDTFIEKKSRLIELLKEQKQAIINKAVTKGIDPDVPMKPSGIEWLGEIPEHWEVKKLKYILQEVSEKSVDGRGKLLMVSQEHGVVERAKYHKKAEVAVSAIGHKKCKEGDLVFNKLKAHLGVFFKTEFDGLVSPDYAVYRSKCDMNLVFFEYLFRHPVYIYQFNTRVTGIVEGLMRLYTSELFDIMVALPKEDELLRILNSIRQEANSVDNVIARTKKEISLIQEYKTTLIAEAVTGKIDVRNWQAKQDAEKPQTVSAK
ncbi:MAG: restriction endonuclease subunit S [Mameliella sp.]|nr:restriction endonuclease subunit S [Phaeodactylibacter sp.]